MKTVSLQYGALFVLMLLIPLYSCSRDAVREEVEVEVVLRFDNYDYESRPERIDSVPWVEVVYVSDIYPLIPMVYFDADVDTLGPYYTERRYPYRPEAADSMLPGGTIMKNSYLLDILGWRLANASTGDLLLEPTYTTESSESSGLANGRAEAVRRYLVDSWEIDPVRLPISPPRQVRCPDGDTICRDDLRGVRLSSNDPELLRTITITEWRRFEVVEQFHVTMHVKGNYAASENGELVWRRKDGEVTRFPLKRREVNIEEGVKVEEYVGSFEFEDEMMRPGLETHGSPYPDTASASGVISVDSKIYESRSVQLVEREVTSWTTRELHDWRPTYRYTLVLFERDSSSVDDAGRKALREHVLPVLDSLEIEEVEITGLYSTGEAPEVGQRRAETVFDALVAMGFAPGRLSEVDVIRRDSPIYLQDTPRGRALQRTVGIVLRGK